MRCGEDPHFLEDGNDSVLVGEKEAFAVFDAFFGRVEGGEEGGQGGVFFWFERCVCVCVCVYLFIYLFIYLV